VKEKLSSEASYVWMTDASNSIDYFRVLPENINSYLEKGFVMYDYQTRFILNKYHKIYFNIIKKAIHRSKPNCYTEIHHVIPKSLGGNNDKENLVILTAREHFICHQLLTKFTIGKDKKKMITAARFMSVVKNNHQDRYINSYLYEIIKKKYAESLKGHKHFGPFHQSKESNDKRSKTLKAYRAKHGGTFKGKKHSIESRALMSKAQKGKKKPKRTPEQIENMRKAAKNRKPYPKTECCGHMWDPGNLAKHRKSGKCTLTA